MAAVTPLRVVDGGSMDKDKALAAALSQIERNFGKGTVMRFGEGPIAQVEASIWATCNPGTMRNSSGMLVMPELRISSAVIT